MCVYGIIAKRMRMKITKEIKEDKYIKRVCGKTSGREKSSSLFSCTT